MDNINDILRAKRIVRQNGYTIKKPARDYDYEREDRMNLIRAKRIVKDAGYSYVKPNDGVTDNSDDFDTVPTRRTRYQDDFEPRRRAADDFDDTYDERPPRVRDEFEPSVRRRSRPVEQDDFDDDVPPVRRRPRPSEDDSFTTRRQRLERPAPVQGGDEPNFPGRRRMREPVKPEGEPAPAAPAANPAPAAPATEDKPRQKTRQEIYQDIAAKYV